MYTYTRQEAADILNISTRSIDRYAKSGKIRSKKMGKIIYLHADDVNNLGVHGESKKAHIIMPKKDSYTEQKSQETSIEKSNSKETWTLEKIYLDLRSEIKTKDQAIQDLSIKLGRAQEIAKNSVSLIEFKKSQFLLEESKWHLSGENTKLKDSVSELNEQLKYEKITNVILIVFCIILLIAVWLIWFLGI